MSLSSWSLINDELTREAAWGSPPTPAELSCWGEGCKVWGKFAYSLCLPQKHEKPIKKLSRSWGSH